MGYRFKACCPFAWLEFGAQAQCRKSREHWDKFLKQGTKSWGLRNWTVICHVIQDLQHHSDGPTCQLNSHQHWRLSETWISSLPNNCRVLPLPLRHGVEFVVIRIPSWPNQPSLSRIGINRFAALTVWLQACQVPTSLAMMCLAMFIVGWCLYMCKRLE